MLKRGLPIILSISVLSVVLARLFNQGKLFANPGHCSCQTTTINNCGCQSQMCGITTNHAVGTYEYSSSAGNSTLIMPNPNVGPPSMPSPPWSSVSLQPAEQQSLMNAVAGLSASGSAVAHIDMSVNSNNQLNFKVDSNPTENKDTIANGAILKVRSGERDLPLLVIPSGDSYGVLAGRAAGH